MEDFDIKRWRDFDYIKTSSLWTAGFSDLSPSDFGIPSFHGRYHPEIPFQMMLRYTKVGDVVWDPFAGGGTTIDVGHLLERKVIANDIFSTREDIICANSMIWRPDILVDLVMLHPPYWSMIKFSDKESDLANAPTLCAYLLNIALIVRNVYESLKDRKYACLVISDLYNGGELLPLGALLYAVFKECSFVLKGKIIKDFGETKGSAKTNAKNKRLWRYRCLKYGLWELGIDEIYIYQKKGDSQDNVGIA